MHNGSLASAGRRREALFRGEARTACTATACPWCGRSACRPREQSADLVAFLRSLDAEATAAAAAAAALSLECDCQPA